MTLRQLASIEYVGTVKGCIRQRKRRQQQVVTGCRFIAHIKGSLELRGIG